MHDSTVSIDEINSFKKRLNVLLRSMAVLSLYGVVGMGVALGVLTVLKVRGGTTEFSPERLEFRYLEVRYIPILDIPISSRVAKAWPHPVRKMWEDRGYLCEPVSEVHWDLVRYWTPGSPETTTLLADLTNAKEVGFPEAYERWTADNPIEADKFWPEVISSIRARKYDESISSLKQLRWDAGY